MTTSTPTLPAEATDYFDRVRAALADLPAADLDDLLEDLQLHLAEVAAEAEGTLVERLGPPELYAADLRASAGLPPPARRRAAVLSVAAAACAAALERPFVRNVAEFMPSLRPAWWVLRGYLVIAIPAFLRGRVDSTFPIPDIGGPVLGAVLVVAAILLSVWVGQNSHRLPGARAFVIGVNVVAAVLAVAAGIHVHSDIQQRAFEDAAFGTPQATPTPSEYAPYLLSPNGRITNIYPYDSAGHPLHGVLLYDESGNPIDLPDQPDINGNQLTNRFPTDADGNEIRNSYPVPQTVQPQDCSQPCPSSQVTPPQPATPTPSPSTTPTPTPKRTQATTRHH